MIASALVSKRGKDCLYQISIEAQPPRSFGGARRRCAVIRHCNTGIGYSFYDFQLQGYSIRLRERGG